MGKERVLHGEVRKRFILLTYCAIAKLAIWLPWQLTFTVSDRQGSPVAGKLSARCIALAGNYCDGNRRAQHNCKGGGAEDSNQANSI